MDSLVAPDTTVRDQQIDEGIRAAEDDRGDMMLDTGIDYTGVAPGSPSILNPYEPTLRDDTDLLRGDIDIGITPVSRQQPTVAGPMDYLQPDYQSPSDILARDTDLEGIGITPVSRQVAGPDYTYDPMNPPMLGEKGASMDYMLGSLDAPYGVHPVTGEPYQTPRTIADQNRVLGQTFETVSEIEANDPNFRYRDQFMKDLKSLPQDIKDRFNEIKESPLVQGISDFTSYLMDKGGRQVAENVIKIGNTTIDIAKSIKNGAISLIGQALTGVPGLGLLASMLPEGGPSDLRRGIEAAGYTDPVTGERVKIETDATGKMTTGPMAGYNIDSFLGDPEKAARDRADDIQSTIDNLDTQFSQLKIDDPKAFEAKKKTLEDRKVQIIAFADQVGGVKELQESPYTDDILKDATADWQGETTEVGIEDEFLGTPDEVDGPDDSVPSSAPEMDFTDEFAGMPSAPNLPQGSPVELNPPAGNGGNEGGHGGNDSGLDPMGGGWWAKGGLIRRPYAKGGIVSVMPTKFNKY